MQGAGRGGLAAIAALCLAGVAAALVAQHVYDLRPCPWCILQRVLFVAIALVALIGAAVGGRVAPRLAGGLVVLAAGGGIAAALHQHLVAARQDSCALTFADRVLTALGLESMLPSVFGVTASCAEAAVDLLGLPFEYWSLALFALAAAIALGVLLRRS